MWRDETLLVEGYEVRVWATPHPDDATRIKAEPIPPEVKARFGAERAA